MSVNPIQIGPLSGKPGQLVYGQIPILELPSGTAEVWPVLIAQGPEPGPCLWLTANIHGDELTGVAAIHQVVTPKLAAALRGTIVAIPSLNPAGLRVEKRQPYYLDEDPNRLWPSGCPPEDDPDAKKPSALELAYARLFQIVQDTADFLLDLHNAGMRSIPFIFRDRVLYRKGEGGEARIQAEALQAHVGELCAAFGLPVVVELPVKHWLGKKLHRSVSGAAVNLARIPAVTVELGSWGVVTPDALEAATVGIHNVLVWAGMVDGELRPNPAAPHAHQRGQFRRRRHPLAPASGLVRHLVRPGQPIESGQPVAELRDIYGRPVGEGVIRTEYSGWVISLQDGILAYPNRPIATLAIPDDQPLVDQYSEDVC